MNFPTTDTSCAIELQLLRREHGPALLEFERLNRAYFAASIPDRGDDFFTTFYAQHEDLLRRQSEKTDYFHVVMSTSGDVVGRINLMDVSEGSAELGYRIAQTFSRRGCATSAVRQVRAIASSQYGLNRLRAKVTCDNVASLRVLERNEFHFVDDLILNGKPARSFTCNLV